MNLQEMDYSKPAYWKNKTRSPTEFDRKKAAYQKNIHMATLGYER
jgi:hypothetical protein